MQLDHIVQVMDMKLHVLLVNIKILLKNLYVKHVNLEHIIIQQARLYAIFGVIAVKDMAESNLIWIIFTISIAQNVQQAEIMIMAI
mgnify:CR=1 FL=1